MSAFDLSGKVILVSGASAGIGRGTAVCISQHGGKVVLTGRNETELNKTLDLLEGEGHIALSADLSDTTSRTDLIDKCPVLDGFVSAAGISKKSPIKYLLMEEIEETMAVNFYAPVMITNDLVKANKLNKGASLVYISSLAINLPFYGGTAYGASKAALVNFAKTAALELARKGIRANSITPGMVETGILQQLKDSLTDEQVDELKNKYPLGFGEPEDIGNLTVYLLSGASKWMTGTDIQIDGGLFLQR